MKIYIISRYGRDILNAAIAAELKVFGEVFLPERLAVEEVSMKQQTIVKSWLEQIDASDIVLLVEPLGKAGAFSVGYAYMQKQIRGRNLSIIRLGKPNKKSAMLDQCIDISFNDAIEGDGIGPGFPDLMNYLINLPAFQRKVEP